MVTNYGRTLRKIRIDNGEVLGDMAEKLSISSAYLSSIENGGRTIPQDLTKKIAEIYSLKTKQIKELEKAEIDNIKEVKVSFSTLTSNVKKETAMIFARTFNNVTEDDFIKIRNILTQKEETKK